MVFMPLSALHTAIPDNLESTIVNDFAELCSMTNGSQSSKDNMKRWLELEECPDVQEAVANDLVASLRSPTVSDDESSFIEDESAPAVADSAEPSSNELPVQADFDDAFEALFATIPASNFGLKLRGSLERVRVDLRRERTSRAFARPTKQSKIMEFFRQPPHPRNPLHTLIYLHSFCLWCSCAGKKKRGDAASPRRAAAAAGRWRLAPRGLAPSLALRNPLNTLIC